MRDDGRPKTQVRHARDQVASKVLHGLIPWCAWLAVTAVFGPVGLAERRWAWLLAGAVLLLGTALAAFAAHLHGSRMSAAGRLMAPATIALGAAATAAWLTDGFSVPLAVVWVLGGATVCIGWDMWLHSAGGHELSIGFGEATATVWGSAAKLTAQRQPRAGAPQPEGPPRSRASRSRAPRQPLAGRVQLPPEVGRDEAAATLDRIEQALQMPSGSVSMTPVAGNSALADWTASDPTMLDVPEPWPGPSAPGAGMGVPFRLGVWQDGSTALVPMLPGFHKRGMGKSSTAKTMGWHWNQLAEGVTREGYAAVVLDITKGEQFFGCWRPALHLLETGEEGAELAMARLHRMRRMRADKLAKDHHTEWVDGCGVSYLDVFMAEAPDLIRLLPSGLRARKTALVTLEDWTSDVRSSRSAGMFWSPDLQLSLAEEMPTIAGGQLSRITFGVDTPAQAKFGLSERQRAAGCRPEAWGSSKPGMAYWDAPTIDDRHATMPLRFYHWTGGARQAFEYASLYPASDRPLDDVTGEALAWTPPVSPSSALPGPGGTLPGNVRPLFGGKPARPDAYEAMMKAEKVALDQLEAWLAEGKTTFTSLDMQKAKVDVRAGRSRSWLYDVIATFQQTGVIEFVTDKPKRRWRIIPAAERGQARDQEAEEE